jgi:pimeloyl-ACP methyl ester carboxylesterase
VFGREQQTRLLELIPGARLHVYEGVGHAPHWENPEDFSADLVAFLREGESPASG